MSNLLVRERNIIRDLKEPILLTAFSSREKGGATAASALAYAVAEWQAQPVADFDAEACYHDARMRPWVRHEGDKTVVDWPENIIYRVDAPNHSYLVLIGVEPSLNWRQYVASIGDFATSLGVRTAVNLKSVPAMVPHTFDAPLRAIYSSPELKEEYGFHELEDKEGPGDIGRILNLHLASIGCRTIDLYAMEPFYAPGIPNAAASLSLLRALKDGFDLTVDVESVMQAAELQREAIDAAVSSSEPLRETVSAMERRPGLAGDSAEGEPPLALDGRAPQSELEASDVLNEAEEILRSSR
jgi:hypothetical protein